MLARREEVGLQVLNVEYHRDAQRELVWPAIAAAERAATQALGKVDEEARFRIFRTRLIVTIWGQALKCKDPRFAQEREVRVVWEPPCEREEDYGLKMGYRASRGKLTRFYELPIGVAKDQQPIKAVTLGPKNAFELDDVRKVVAESGYNIACVTFSKSGLPYR